MALGDHPLEKKQGVAIMYGLWESMSGTIRGGEQEEQEGEQTAAHGQDCYLVLHTVTVPQTLAELTP